MKLNVSPKDASFVVVLVASVPSVKDCVPEKTRLLNVASTKPTVSPCNRSLVVLFVTTVPKVTG